MFKPKDKEDIVSIMVLLISFLIEILLVILSSLTYIAYGFVSQTKAWTIITRHYTRMPFVCLIIIIIIIVIIVPVLLFVSRLVLVIVVVLVLVMLVRPVIVISIVIVMMFVLLLLVVN